MCRFFLFLIVKLVFLETLEVVEEAVFTHRAGLCS
jgi:hypothetical protein